MSGQEPLSKLPRRQAIVYCDGTICTGNHELWQRRQLFDSAALMLTYNEA